ncbi:hypothetical protein OC835_000327 [Tilletia horrida]|nr:hypothetical protein OC835_000327 [Tilletia horrida]
MSVENLRLLDASEDMCKSDATKSPSPPGHVVATSDNEVDSRLEQSLTPLSMVVPDDATLSVTSTLTDEEEAEFTPPPSGVPTHDALPMSLFQDEPLRSESVPLPNHLDVIVPPRASSARPPPEGPVYLTEEFFQPYAGQARAHQDARLSTLFTPSPPPEQSLAQASNRRGRAIILDSQDTVPSQQQRGRRVLDLESSGDEEDDGQDNLGESPSQHSVEWTEPDGVKYEAFIPVFTEGPGSKAVRILTESEDEADDDFVVQRVIRNGASGLSALGPVSAVAGPSRAGATGHVTIGTITEEEASL